MRGIILAGGTGARLLPTTAVVSKQLLPVFDKPMIYYPLATLMLAGIRDILLISTPQDRPLFERLFGNGSDFGLAISYASQDQPRGVADAFLIARDFIGSDRVALVLGDNILYGRDMRMVLTQAARRVRGATVFGYAVDDPQQYGVVELDERGRPRSIEEKPDRPKSNLAVIGLYFYDDGIVDVARSIKPSLRGELEITDINRIYLERGELNVEVLGHDFSWLDIGSYESLADASHFVRTLERREGLRIACPEEIALKLRYISLDEFYRLAQRSAKSGYGDYLMSIYRSHSNL